MAKLKKIDITPKIINLEKSHHKDVNEVKKEVKQTVKPILKEEKAIEFKEEEKKKLYQGKLKKRNQKK